MLILSFKDEIENVSGMLDGRGYLKKFVRRRTQRQVMELQSESVGNGQVEVISQKTNRVQFS